MKKRPLENRIIPLFFFLLFITAVSYSNTLYSPFVLDDLSAFVNNKNLYIEDISSESLAKLSHTRFGYARIIPIASFALNHYIGQGKSILNYHVTNILVHLLATVCLAFLLRGLMKTRGASDALRFFRPEYFTLGVCALWALAPIQTNAVTYLVQRMTSMAAMFYLAACAFYVHARLSGTGLKRFVLYSLCLLAAGCSLFSKENSATLPAAIILVEFMFISPDLGVKLIRATRWYHYLAVLIVVMLFFPVIENFVSRQLAGFHGRHFTLSGRLLTELRIVVFYMSLLLLPLPSRMNLEHDFLLSTSLISPPATFFSMVLLLALLGVGVYCRKKSPFISFGIFWYFLHLVIESSFIPLELIFEHRVYLPSVGFFIALLYVIDRLCATLLAGKHPEIKKIVFLFFVIILSVSSILTSLRNNDWRDRLSIYEDSMQKSPLKARAVSNYAMALGKAGHYEECVKYGLQVQSLGMQGYEDFMNSATNVLTCLLLQEKYTEAVKAGEQIKNDIMQKDLDYIAAGAMNKYMFNLAMAYTEDNQYRKAYETFQIALFRAPHDMQTYKSLNRLFILAQQNEQGREELNISEDFSEIPVRLAKIAYNYRQYDYADLYLKDAAKSDAAPDLINPFREKLAETVEQNKLKAHESSIRNDKTYKNSAQFRLYMNAADFILRKYKFLQGGVAGLLLQQAQELDPDNPFIPVYRARWHMANNQIDSAIKELEQFLQKNDNFVPALELLGICYQKKKEYEKSVSIFSHILDTYHGHSQWANYLSYIYKYEDIGVEQKRSPLDYY